MRYVVGVDQGTTGCKAGVFDEGGNLIASAYKEYRSYYPHAGWVEQDVLEIREAVFGCIRRAIGESGVVRDDVKGVSHANFGISAVLLDEVGNPVRTRTIGWQDLRYVGDLERYRQAVDLDAYWEISGMGYGTFNNPVFTWIQEHDPETWFRTARICSYQDWFTHQYGADGWFIDEGSANFFGMTRMEDSEWDQRLLDVYGLKMDMMPEVVHEPGRVVGRVSAPVSEQTGLPVGCAVCLGNVDTGSCSIGAGATEAGTQVLIMGTGGVSLFVTDRAVRDPARRQAIRPNPAGKGTWQYYLMTNTGASSFRWFRDELCSMESATARLMDADPYDLITRAASTSVPGANGVIALTGFQGSHTRVKNENARGTFFGVTLGTRKADIAEAILEGICYEMRDILSMNEELGGEIRRVRLCGGVAKSDYWCQMFADVLKKPIELTEQTELGCLGSAICAGVGAGIFPSVEEGIRRCVRVSRVFEPDTERAAAYDEVFAEWTRLYGIANEQVYV